MGTNAATRKKALAEGMCGSCYDRPLGTRVKGLCDVCAEQHRQYLIERYHDRRAKGLCVQCGKPANGYLCDKHEAMRQKRRRASAR